MSCANFIGLVLFVSTSTDMTQSHIIYFLLYDSQRFIPTSWAVTKHTSVPVHIYTLHLTGNSHHRITQTVHVMAGSTALAAPSLLSVQFHTFYFTLLLLILHFQPP